MTMAHMTMAKIMQYQQKLHHRPHLNGKTAGHSGVPLSSQLWQEALSLGQPGKKVE
jgi:hypothetical protein